MCSRDQVEKYVATIKKVLKSYRKEALDVYIIPDFMSFEVVRNGLKDMPINIGVQDIFWEDYGSYAGEVAPLLLKDIGCKCAYIGHSERKIYFNETNESINKKVLACYRNGIAPFIYVGETREEFEKEMTSKVLKEQLYSGLMGIPAEFMKDLVIIYEPRWAIGQKDAASPEIIENCHQTVREIVEELYNNGTAEITRILYGGSVNLENISSIINCSQVDGVASTRFSLNPLNFEKMVSIVAKEAEKRLLKYKF
jgi:triosephosphate isomerase